MRVAQNCDIIRRLSQPGSPEPEICAYISGGPAFLSHALIIESFFNVTSIMSDPAVTYNSYLKIDELLSLQQVRSGGMGIEPEHDETLFIIIHQVYELWFKQLIHEIVYLKNCLESSDHATAVATLKRMLTILKTVVSQIDVLETITPVSFASFRDRLESASGFQSYQFREFEFLCGNKRERLIEHYPEGTTGRRQLQKRFEEPTIYDSFLRYLQQADYAVPHEALQRDITQVPQEWPGVQKVLIDIYHNNPKNRQLCELLVDFDEGLQEWRYRHVKMVERTIGFKQGTGGSSGAGYLRTTLFNPMFPDLWAIRTEL